jgi:hypothetical protein
MGFENSPWRWVKMKQYYHSSVTESFEVARQLPHPKNVNDTTTKECLFLSNWSCPEGK